MMGREVTNASIPISVYIGYTDAQSMLTVSDEKEEPPFLGKFAENHDEHEVEHHSLTHHPAEGRQEQILEQSSHYSANNLWSRTMHDDPNLVQ